MTGHKATGSEALLKTLEKNKVETIFGYPGGVLLGLYDHIYAQEKIRHILVRHEQGGAHAADGYARVARKAGVTLATSGPGATNLITGLCSAQMDSIPVVALTGQVPSSMIGKDAFQEADLFNLSLPVTKHSYQVRETSKIPAVVDQAFEIATGGRPGVVLVDLPKDILNTSIEWSDETEMLPKVKAPSKKKWHGSQEIVQAAKLILEARKPVLYIGGGVVNSGSHHEVIRLAESALVPVAWTLMGKGAVPDDHPLNLGMLGMHGMPAANYAVYESDLLIAVGVRFDDRATGKLETFAPEAKVIHIEIDPAEIGKNRKIQPGVDLALLGDAREVLTELLEVIQERQAETKAWIERVSEWQKEYPLDNVESHSQITPHQIFRILNEVAKDAIYTTDVGQHQMWAAQYLNTQAPGRWITSGGLGTMGFGLPAAIGAKAAAQDIGLDRPVICVSGDGSFQMCQQELGTTIAHHLPVTSIILNNGNLGMVRQWQELFFNLQYSCSDLRDGSPDFVKLGEAYGIKGLKLDQPQNLKEAIKEAIESDQSYVLDLRIHPEANVFPIVPAGGSNHRAEGIGLPTVPSHRTEADYDRDVERAPIARLHKKPSRAKTI
ncbi:MAG: biosynthetic-type acetolactate synthase large subunit [Candidatus Caenarcaniphilales bacterium]|nr:biosynthetic-type acetolactate synthase large subunit [Candidatus Caenarcaniphilales bacterium]